MVVGDRGFVIRSFSARLGGVQRAREPIVLLVLSRSDTSRLTYLTLLHYTDYTNDYYDHSIVLNRATYDYGSGHLRQDRAWHACAGLLTHLSLTAGDYVSISLEILVLPRSGEDYDKALQNTQSQSLLHMQGMNTSERVRALPRA